jgi:protein-disulfide isomerase
MPSSFALAHPFSALKKLTGLVPSLALSLALAALLASAAVAHAQFAVPSGGTQVHDPSALKPPSGARVAIVEFEDMECPDCGRANPLLKQAAANYKIPWVRHDFPLPMHSWSFNAAVNARWFDAAKGKALGDEYRDEVFANQASISNPDALRQFTERFAAGHHIALPFAIDPQGKLAAGVKADQDLGRRIGIEHTPTIWVVTANSKGAPFVEVVDRGRLYQLIDQALADTASAKTPVKTPVKTSAKKPAGN